MFSLLYWFGGFATAATLLWSLWGYCRWIAILIAIASALVWPAVIIFFAFLGKKEMETA